MLRSGAVAMVALALALPAHAARVGVLSDAFAAATAANLAVQIPGNTYTGVDVSQTTPSLASLTASFDLILLYEDGVFGNSTPVGNVVAQFAQAGHAVILATFYDQDRSDATNGSTVPHGWGTLEALDPDTTDGVGTAYALRTLDPTSIVASPLTVGVTSLAALRGNPGPYAGGNQAKPGTFVVATWAQPNALGLPDPAIAYRITGDACVIQIGIAVDYPVLTTFNTLGTDFSGNYYQVWANAFAFGATGCQVAIGPGNPAQIALGWPNRASLDYWRAGFSFAITLDGKSIQAGFGPSLVLHTNPDGSIST